MLGKLMNTYQVYKARISPALNESSALQYFECSNAIETCNRIMFNSTRARVYNRTRDCHICGLAETSDVLVSA